MTNEQTQQTTADLISPLCDEAGALLPILHALQDHFSYIPPQSVGVVAKALNLSRAEVHGVISFYDWFHNEPQAPNILYICRAESCRAMGGAALEATAKRLLDVDYHQTTRDGRVTLQPVYCLGNCACSPSIMLNQRLYSRVTPEGLAGVLADLGRGEN